MDFHPVSGRLGVGLEVHFDCLCFEVGQEPFVCGVGKIEFEASDDRPDQRRLLGPLDFLGNHEAHFPNPNNH